MVPDPVLHGAVLHGAVLQIVGGTTDEHRPTQIEKKITLPFGDNICVHLSLSVVPKCDGTKLLDDDPA